MLRIASITILLAAAAAPAAARDIFVNNRVGDDRAGGHYAVTSDRFDGPVATIGRALAIALPYDRIVVANTGEPYRECITMQAGRNSGQPTIPFILEGNGAVLEGSVPVPYRHWEAVGAGDPEVRSEVFRYRPKKFTYPMLYLGGRPAERVPADELAKDPPALEPLQWCMHRQWIYFRIEKEKSIADYDLTQAWHDVGITLYQVHDVIVADLVIQGFRLDGVNCFDNARGALLVGLTCRGNGRSGIAVDNSSSGIQIRACLLGDNGTAQLWADGYSHTEVVESVLLEGSAPKLHRGEHADVKIDGEQPGANPEDTPPALPGGELN